MSQLGTFHWPDLDLRAPSIAKMSQPSSFEFVSLPIKREGTRRVTVTLQGIGEGAKRNSTLQRSPGRKPTRPRLLLVLSASAAKHPVSADWRVQSWPTDGGRLTLYRNSLARGEPRPDAQSKKVVDELEDQGIPVRFRPCRLVCRRSARRGECFAFHLRTALLLARRKHTLSGRDRRAAEDKFRAAGASNPHRKRLCGLENILRRLRRGLGRSRPKEPTQPSHSGNSIRHRSARCLFHHHDRRGDETTASRQRLSVGGHLALQGTHHRRGRRDRIPDVRPLSADELRRRRKVDAAGEPGGAGRNGRQLFDDLARNRLRTLALLIGFARPHWS